MKNFIWVISILYALDFMYRIYRLCEADYPKEIDEHDDGFAAIFSVGICVWALLLLF